jgi:hypothetical protein
MTGQECLGPLEGQPGRSESPLGKTIGSKTPCRADKNQSRGPRSCYKDAPKLPAQNKSSGTAAMPAHLFIFISPSHFLKRKTTFVLRPIKSTGLRAGREDLTIHNRIREAFDIRTELYRRSRPQRQSVRQRGPSEQLLQDGCRCRTDCCNMQPSSTAKSRVDHA